MKNWIARLLGGASTRVSTRAASRPGQQQAQPAPGADASAAPAPGADLDAARALDLAFYRWLAGAAGGGTAPALEALVLGELARLAHAPAQAAALMPRVPAVIPELLRSLRDESVSGADLARMIAQDVVLVGEVIREANSSWYRPPTPVRTIEGALLLLGRNGLRMLLARVAFRPVFKLQGGRLVAQAAPQVWSQSERCAFAASTLAPSFGADPFEAYLAGLVQNVGLLVALRLIDQAEGGAALPDSPAFARGLLGQARRLSHGIALHWQFPENVAGAIVEEESGHASALARVLATGDRLAKLRLLADAGALPDPDPLLRAIVGTRLRPCYDQLRPRPAEEH
ncbi:MAG: HDOD domain-containing protein [Pseudomonadota bacterium]